MKSIRYTLLALFSFCMALNSYGMDDRPVSEIHTDHTKTAGPAIGLLNMPVEIIRDEIVKQLVHPFKIDIIHHELGDLESLSSTSKAFRKAVSPQSVAALYKKRCQENSTKLFLMKLLTILTPDNPYNGDYDVKLATYFGKSQLYVTSKALHRMNLAHPNLKTSRALREVTTLFKRYSERSFEDQRLFRYWRYTTTDKAILHFFNNEPQDNQPIGQKCCNRLLTIDPTNIGQQLVEKPSNVRMPDVRNRRIICGSSSDCLEIDAQENVLHAGRSIQQVGLKSTFTHLYLANKNGIVYQRELNPTMVSSHPQILLSIDKKIILFYQEEEQTALIAPHITTLCLIKINPTDGSLDETFGDKGFFSKYVSKDFNVFSKYVAKDFNDHCTIIGETRSGVLVAGNHRIDKNGVYLGERQDELRINNAFSPDDYAKRHDPHDPVENLALIESDLNKDIVNSSDEED